MTAVNIEDISPVQKKLSFDVSWTDVKKELDDVYLHIGKKAKLKGFRPGKIPRRILETYYKDHAEEETVTNLVNKLYWDAVKANGIAVITQPVIDQKGLETDKDFAFSATVEVEPVIEPVAYTGLTLEQEEFEVTEKDVEARLQEIRELFATLQEVNADREVMKGDFTAVDFEGTHDGIVIPSMKAEGYMLEIGSNRFIPGFEDQLTGMKKGESKQFSLTFPADYHAKDMAGKEVTVSVTLKEIREKKLPEINEEFVKNFEKYDSLDSFMADIRKSLAEANQARSETILKERILDSVLESNHFEVPPTFVERQIVLMMSDTQKRLMSGGMDRQTAIRESLKYHDQFKNPATRIVKSMMLLKRIAEKEAVDVEDREMDDRIREIAAERGMSYESLKKNYEDQDMREGLRTEMVNEKVFGFIKEKALITVIKKGDKAEQEKS